MRKLTLLISLFALSISLMAQPPVGDEAFTVIKELYTYDKKLDLNPEILETKEFDNHSREKIYFTGVRERVPAYLAIPKQGRGPYPLILLIDGMGGTKERWWGEHNWPNGLETIEALIDKGYAVMALDAPMHGERKDTSGIFPEPLGLRKADLMLTTRNMIMQNVQGYMRALDYLETRKEIDMNRIGVYGLSMGGATSFILTGLEPRVKATVTGVAVVYGNQYSPVNAYNFTSHITQTPFLMLMGTTDGYYTPESATDLFNTIGEKDKKLIIFEGPHKVPPSYIPTITDWFDTWLSK